MLSWLGKFLSSSIGQKVAMAVSGLALVGYLIVHLAGNLNLYADDTGEAFDAYAAGLESWGPLLWVAEVVLLGIFVAHIALGVRVSLKNREARRRGYRVRTAGVEGSFASRSMLVTGVIVGVFLVIHVIDFRLPKLMGNPDFDQLALAVRARLGEPLGAAIYLVGVGALGVHLWHAFESAFQTLGANHPKYTPFIRGLGRGLAVVLTIGFASFPVYCLLVPAGAAL